MPRKMGSKTEHIGVVEGEARSSKIALDLHDNLALFTAWCHGGLSSPLDIAQVALDVDALLQLKELVGLALDRLQQ